MEEVGDAADGTGSHQGSPARPATPPVGVTTGDLRLTGTADAADLAAYLGRIASLDPTAVVRLRAHAAGGAVTVFCRLPFNVLVSRSARAEEAPPDVTVGAAALLAAVEVAGADGPTAMPSRQDTQWRGPLPPTTGWQQLDRVPVDVVARLVRAGAATLRAIGGQGSAAMSESLLDHEALTVSGIDRTVVLPLRVLSAAWRMGFLGDIAPNAAAGTVAVSASGSWVRLAAPYGSAYHQTSQGLLLHTR
jgi:hypothetical protein